MEIIYYMMAWGIIALFVGIYVAIQLYKSYQ